MKLFSTYFFQNLSIKKKLILTIMGISSMILLTTLSIFSANELISLKRTMLEDMSTLADLVGKNNTGALLFHDSKAANENLLALNAKPHIVSAHFFQTNNKLFAHYHRNQLKEPEVIPNQIFNVVEMQTDGYFYLDDHIHMVKRVIFEEDQSLIGLIYLVSDRKVFWKRVSDYIITIFIMITVLLLLTYLFAVKAQKTFTDPIFRLLESMQKVSKSQDYSQIESAEHADEFGKLIHGYNDMLDQLSQHQKISQDYQSNLEKRVDERTLQLQKARDDALSASRTKSIFLANMSHEIRTPMNAILGYAQLLQQSKLSKDQLRQLSVIDKSGKHLLSLINGILELSKIEAGSIEIHRSDFDLIDLVHNVSNMFRIQCNEKNIVWTIDCFTHEPVLVNGDQGKLRQVLINLIGNAFKFTEQGEILFKIENIAENRYKFSVRDSGSGINSESIEKIFEAFHQEKVGQQKGGTGLGLDISKRYIELLSGRLEVTSTINKGSCFFFDIELLPAHDSSILHEQAITPVYRLKPGTELSALVVDDVKDNSELLDTILTRIGFKVSCAENGVEALEKLKLSQPDIIFLDIRMPVMNGLDTIVHIRQQYSNEQVKCIAISASNMRHQSEYFMAKGFDLFVSKPFRFEAIYYAIRETLGIELIPENSQAIDQHQPVIEPSIPSPVINPSIKIEHELLEKLAQAAEYGQLTELSNLIKPLKNYGSEGEVIANHLDLLINSADLDGILEYIANLEHE